MIDYIGASLLLVGLWLVGSHKPIIGWGIDILGVILFVIWGWFTKNWSIVGLNIIFLFVGSRNLVKAIKESKLQ